MRDLTSDTRAGAPIHSIAWFESAFGTVPTNRETGMTARRLIEDIADEDGPRHRETKERAPYFVPAELRRAPYVGKTADKDEHRGKSGYMRSASHVVSGSWFAFDLDRLDETAWEQVRGSLDASEVLFCGYSTYSHGAKPGTRARVLVFMDRALDPLEWKAAWSAVNTHLLLDRADPATAKLSQQAGAWATHPDRVDRAFRITGGKRLLSADTLLALAPRKEAGLRSVGNRATPFGIAPDAWKESRVIDAVIQLDPLDDYDTWIAVLAGIKGAVEVGDIDETTGRDLWIEASAWASEGHRSRNDDDRYNPDLLWEQTFTYPAEARKGALFQRARDNALARLRQERHTGKLSSTGTACGRYLAKYHHRALSSFLQPATEVA